MVMENMYLKIHPHDQITWYLRSDQQKTRRLYIHFDGSQVENTVIEKNGEQVFDGKAGFTDYLSWKRAER